jgi:hypothetical protein
MSNIEWRREKSSADGATTRYALLTFIWYRRLSRLSLTNVSLTLWSEVKSVTAGAGQSVEQRPQ